MRRKGKPAFRSRNSTEKSGLKKFEEFMRENCDKTQKQMAKLWGDEVT
jgi:hypothetical protein